MVRSVVSSAIVLLALAGTADAACSTKKLTGDWVVSMSNACASTARDCGEVCRGTFNDTGTFTSDECFLIADANFDRRPSVSLKLYVDKNCEVDGTATLRYPDSFLTPMRKVFGWVTDGGKGLKLLVDRETGRDFIVSREISGERVAK